MFTLVNILICFFIFLILYQIILANNVVVEGYTPPENALTMAKTNTNSISQLNTQVQGNTSSITNINQQLQDLSGNILTLQTQLSTLQTQVNGLVQANTGTAPNITGATNSDSSSTSDTS